MRKTVSLIFLFLISHKCLLAQVSDLIFIGSAIVKGGRAFPYKLQVNDSNGILRGYSVMDAQGLNETKTAVKGVIYKDKKQLSFRETKIIYTKSKSAAADFCYIHSNLRIVKVQGAISLKGYFKGYKQDRKTECATGKLVLISGQDLLNKLLKIAGDDSSGRPKTDTLIKAPKNYQIVYEKEVPATKIKNLMPGMLTELICPSHIVSVEIWDSKTIDGDKITLMQDNKPLLENFTISGNRKTVRVDMGKSETVTLRLIAQTEGTEPLNTARIRVVSGNVDYYIDATTTLDRSVRIVLKKKV